MQLHTMPMGTMRMITDIERLGPAVPDLRENLFNHAEDRQHSPPPAAAPPKHSTADALWY